MPIKGKEVSRGKVTERRFDKRDFDFIAEFGIDEWNSRKRRRKDREKHWAEIDRQLEMEPDTGFKYIIENGTRKPDVRKMWMAEMELPLQAQALEVLTADARRMMFPDTGPWFRGHAEVTDAYLQEVDFSSLILGDENDVPSQINQDNADKLAEGFLNNIFRQSDFFTRMDRINAEAFKYGVGVGRGRLDTKNVYIHEARGTRKERQAIPSLIPVSVKNVYLDDAPPNVHSAHVLGEMHILEGQMSLENLTIAANRGSKDPEDEDGGWMPAMLKNIEPDDKDMVTLIELEGDIVVPRKTVRSVVIPNAIATIVVGQEGTKGVVRFRIRKRPFSSYLLFPYHYEHIDTPYSTSPLMKGRPVQMMATDALNRLMDAAMLKNAPPVGYDRSDLAFAAEGGPAIYPYAKWPTTDGVEVHDKIGGDPAALSATLSLAINLYAELTGILPARLGAQTVSHTTAFAKDAELTRGAVRTVDYVRQAGHGPVTRWLDMAYGMGRDALRGDVSLYIDAYGGFVKVDKDALPERVEFEWFGSGGPAEEQAKQQAKLTAVNLALQIDQLAIAQGREPTLDIPSVIREILREGKWTDIDVITRSEEPLGGLEAPPGIPGIAADNAATPSAVVQTLAFGNRG